jgi:hypothetical protein
MNCPHCNLPPAECDCSDSLISTWASIQNYTARQSGRPAIYRDLAEEFIREKARIGARVRDSLFEE